MTNKVTAKKQLYENFHAGASKQKRLINKNNYTYKPIIKVIEQVLPKKIGARVLDYGCGVGALSLYLTNKGYKVTGVDVSDKAISTAIESAKQVNLENKVVFKVLNTNYAKNEKNKYDFILCIEVVEHVPDDKKVINQLYSMLKKEGKLVLSTRSVNSPLYRLGVLKGNEIKVGHVRRYSNETVISLFKNSGFKIEYIQKYDSIIRDVLYNFPQLGFIVKFIRGPITRFFIALEKPLISLFGNCGYILVLSKKD